MSMPADKALAVPSRQCPDPPGSVPAGLSQPGFTPNRRAARTCPRRACTVTCLDQRGIRCSMSRRGDCRASAVVESSSATHKKQRELTLPAGQLDGLVALSDGRLLVSSWETSAVYIVDPAAEPAEVEILAGELPAPADIGRDKRRSRLLVPLFVNNRVTIVAIE